ncbi:hypothetical protein [Acetobacter fallax]|uniref:Uncharacterized protein n=2 Tax=Acetobacter fallax TaxID=1737473 RepID=A0ABX0KF68_9PROT|nr:hypothetical protein [Acetobacter fallax]NHO33768.1 hypothetical protein [Acetobacter fallax]NHO37329.1 hypothetical protein [Acetobacter fallax]
MAQRVEALYPLFRIFLSDEKQVHTIPCTIFGVRRVAIYAGSMYVVFNDSETVMQMQRHFEHLIRHARVQPHDVADTLRQMATSMQDNPDARPFSSSFRYPGTALSAGL